MSSNDLTRATKQTNNGNAAPGNYLKFTFPKKICQC